MKVWDEGAKTLKSSSSEGSGRVKGGGRDYEEKRGKGSYLRETESAHDASSINTHSSAKKGSEGRAGEQGKVRSR